MSANAGVSSAVIERLRARAFVATVCRLLLSAVWLYAGAAKVGDLAGSVRAVKAHQIMPNGMADVVGAALPFVEIALGVLLLIGLSTRIVAIMSALLLGAFVVGTASAWARGLSIDCGCFGSGGELGPGESPGYGLDVTRDALFLAAASFLVLWPRTWLSLDSQLLDGKE